MKSDEFSAKDDDMSLEDHFSITDSGEMANFSELDEVEWVREHEAYCFDNERFAELYVDAIVSSAASQLTTKSKSYKAPEMISPITEDALRNSFRGRNGFGLDVSPIPSSQFSCAGKKTSAGSFSGWPKISEFNIKLGLEKLEEYIESWRRSQEWMCCVEFLGFESEENCNYFVYEVEFSIPTATYPVPQATASVYFSLEVSKMIPQAYDRSVEVSYVFESSNVIHLPGKVHFQENWIRDIIRSKLIFFRSVTF